MEWSLSGNGLKTFARSVACLARIGNQVSIQASPAQIAFVAINSSRSAYLSIIFKPAFFDEYTVSGTQAQCSILLKALSAVLRTSISSIDQLRIRLADPDASRVYWILDCSNGMKKTYWIACNVEPDTQQLSLDKGGFPSNFVVRPRDLNRLLSNFQPSLHEITIIATDPSASPSDIASEIGGKAVELRSYMDPTKDNDSSLHTQLWIDPVEEFVQYTHSGDPVDVTFGLKELKAFLSFCEGGEVDIHISFEKAGEPLLMGPKFIADDGFVSNYDATLVLATMLVSQLHERNQAAPVHMNAGDNHQTDGQQEKSRVNVTSHSSDHTRIWSDLSAKNASGSGIDTGSREAQGGTNAHLHEQREEIQRHYNAEANKAAESQGFRDGKGLSQRHPSNWVGAHENANDDEDDDETEDNEQCIQSTPPYYEEQ
ncbi:hypothetical protein V2J09_019635 [Rumex salicifolius]